MPWIPAVASPAADARIMQIGEDPLYAALSDAQLPLRPDHRAAQPDGVAGGAGAGTGRAPRRTSTDRRTAEPAGGPLGRRCAQAGRRRSRRPARAETINLAWLNHCLHAVIVDADTMVVNEYSFRQEYCPLDAPGSLFGVGPAGGLGWGLARRARHQAGGAGKQVVALLGDGAYMFANPTACHFIGARARSCRC